MGVLVAFLDGAASAGNVVRLATCGNWAFIRRAGRDS